jgi:hypothetical protein
MNQAEIICTLLIVVAALVALCYQRLQKDALDVECRTIIQLRDEFVINDEVLRRIQSDIDHAEARLQTHGVE